VITEASGKARWVVQGTWDERIEGSPVLKAEETKGKLVYETGDKQLLWQRRYPPYVTDIIGIHNSIYLTLTLNLYSYLCANPEQFPDQNADQVACDVS
jgi:hypothetical protein